MISTLFKRSALGLAATLLLASAVQAAPITTTKTRNVDVTGVESRDALGSAGNEIRSLFIGVKSLLTGLSIEAELEAYNPSFLAEISIRVSNSLGDFFDLMPSFELSSGVESISFAEADLTAALGYEFRAGNDGWLSFEFYESFDDFADDVDGIWNSGLLGITSTVPEPAGLALAGLALAGLSARRRRNAA